MCYTAAMSDMVLQEYRIVCDDLDEAYAEIERLTAELERAQSQGRNCAEDYSSLSTTHDALTADVALLREENKQLKDVLDWDSKEFDEVGIVLDFQKHGIRWYKPL